MASADRRSPHRPHILFILADQLRCGFLSAYGAGFVDTPNIDRIGREGVRYQRAYSPHPVCVSARVSLLTGHDAIVTGALHNGQFLRPDHRALGMPTWPELLSDAGYHTCAVGKMHFYPWDLKLGFQERIVCEDKRWLLIEDDYFHFLKERGHRKYHGDEHADYHENRGAVVSLLPWDCYWDHFVGSQAAARIRQYEGDAPLAMMVGFPGPHCPYDPTPGYLAGVDESAMPPAVPEVAGDHPRLRQNNIDGNRLPWNGVDYTDFTEDHKRKIRAHYTALVKQIDDEVGAILQALEERGLLDDTLVIFGSDHGDYLGDHNLIGKGTFFEASCHVPLLVRPPTRQRGGDSSPGQVCGDLVSLTDICATLLGFAGLEPPHTPSPDRSSHVPDLDRWLQPQAWERDAASPCVTLGPEGAFDDMHLFAPCVALEDGQFRLWYSGSRGDVRGRVFRLGLATSRDGVTFERRPESPVFEVGDGRHSVLTPSLLRGPEGQVVREDGRLRLWFANTDFPNLSGVHTLHETGSDDGLHWDPPSQIQLEAAYAPSVLRVDNEYRLWYTDVAQDPWCFRHGRSDDGRIWKVDAEPVLKVDQAWEQQRLFYPTVVAVDGGFVLYYGSYQSADPQKTALGVAVSEDGITWRKSPHNPVFGPDASRNWESHYTTSQTVMRLPDGSWRMWYASRPAPPFAHKYLAIGTARWEGPE